MEPAFSYPQLVMGFGTFHCMWLVCASSILGGADLLEIQPTHPCKLCAHQVETGLACLDVTLRHHHFQPSPNSDQQWLFARQESHENCETARLRDYGVCAVCVVALFQPR